MNDTCTYANGALELEGRPLQEGGAVVVAAGHQTIRPRLFDVHAVDDLTVTHNLSHRRARIPEEHGAEPAQTHTGQHERAGFERRGAWPVAVTHFSRPSPTTATLLLSSVQAMSLIFPPKGWYSYFSRCSFCVVSQIRIFPDTSAQKQTHSRTAGTHGAHLRVQIRHSPPDAM